MTFFFFPIIILFINIKLNISKYIIYQFQQIENSNFSKPSEIISYLLSLEYVTNITLAEPPQIIKSYIDFTKFHFYISNVTSNREYIIEKSKSFSTIYDHDYILYTYSFLEGKYANETLYVNIKDSNISSKSNNINNDEQIIEVKNFTFSMPSKLTIKNRKMFPSSIGLGFYAYNSNHQLNFLLQLNSKNIINNTYFYIDFLDNINGNLYIGEMPHIIYPKRYKFENYEQTYTYIDNVLDEWSFRIDFIYNFAEDKNLNDTKDYIYKKNGKLVFDLNLNGIILDMNYLKIFNKTFFDKYFKDKICKMEKIESISYIYCNKDKVNIKKFKNIYFYQKDFNYTFTLDYNDLFYIQNNILIFNLFFDENGFSHLLNVGKIFLKKYLLVFNYDQKSIGFYKTKEESGLKLENNKDFSNKVVKLYIIGIMVLIILGLIILFIKGFNKKTGRKIRKNELDDDFDYTIQNNEEK